MTLRRDYYFGIRVGGGGYGPIYSNTASLETVHRGLLNPKFRVRSGDKLTNLPIKMCYGYRYASPSLRSKINEKEKEKKEQTTQRLLILTLNHKWLVLPLSDMTTGDLQPSR